MNVNDRIKKIGITIPEPPAAGGIYTPALEFGERFVYTSGCGPQVNGVPVHTGKLGSDLTLEQGQEAARTCILNVLSVVKKQIGDLDRIKKVVKILSFVACSENFFDQPKVINAASQVLIDIFGEESGKAARSAIGTNVLPGNIPVEIEVLFELK
jgi:Putative translation initiation inhibitor, yjgF family